MKAKHIDFNIVVFGQEAEKAEDIKPDVTGYKRLATTARALEILCTSSDDEGAHSPAQSISINREVGIRALRDFCNELLGEASPQLLTKEQAVGK